MRRLLSLVAFVGLVVPSAFAAPQEKDGGKGKDAPGEGAKPEGGKGDEKGGQEHRLAEIDKHIQQEIDKHAERTAKIDRLVELVGSKKDEKSAAELKEMREHEDARHAKAMKRLDEQRARVVEGKDAGDDDEKDKPGHGGGAKDKEKGDDKAKDKAHDKGDDGKEGGKGKGKDKEKDKDKDDGGDEGKEKHGKKDKDDGHDKGGK